MKKLISYMFCIVVIAILFSCAGEKKDVLYQIPLETKVKECSIIFSLDGEHFAFIKEGTEGEAVIYNGNTDKTYLIIDALCLSPSGTHYAYLATDGKSEIVVKDGEEIAHYKSKTIIRRDKEFKTIQLLNDGSVIYTKKETKNMKKVYKNNKPIDASPYSSMPEVSKNGNHLLFWSIDGTGDHLVFDGKKKKIKDIPLFLAISGDGKHYGAIIREGKNKNAVLIDGAVKISFDSKNTVVLFALSEKGEHYVLVQSDRASGDLKIKYDGVIVYSASDVFTHSISFSDDDLHYALVIFKPPMNRAGLLLDGKEIPSFDPNFSTINECFKEGRPLVFDPTGTHLLYIAGSGTNQIVALDQKVQIRFDLYNTEVYQQYFSSEKEISCLIHDKINKQIVRVRKTLQ